jgi:hypothetical protein
MVTPVDWRAALKPKEYQELEELEAHKNRLDEARGVCSAKINRIKSRGIKRGLRARIKNA